MSLEHFDIAQDHEGEWWSVRAGLVTGSKIASIMANYGNAFGEPAKAYAAQIAVEQNHRSACQRRLSERAHAARQ